MAITNRLKHAWNAFLGRDPTPRNYTSFYGGWAGGYRPHVHKLHSTNERSIVGSIYCRIAVDCSGININHVKVDEDGRFKEIIKDRLNEVLTHDANIDQTGRSMIRDGIISMLDEGVVAFAPVITEEDPYLTESWEVEEVRVGKIVEWMPKDVRIDVYNDVTGRHEEIVMSKRVAAIVENPFYEIMNEPNSTLQRLKRVLSQLDSLNNEASAGKMDLIIQLPYTVKSEARKKLADSRRREVEAQLTNSQYGIAYIDGTERVIQLNRSLENNLWEQAKDLTEQVYNQLGLTKSIFDGTADEKTMLNYNNQTIEPILTAITESMQRTWISRTARKEGEAIRFFKDPFKLVPVAQLAEISDKFTRNCITTSNEIRSFIGMKPANDPMADKLVNSNLNQPEGEGSKEVIDTKKTTKVDIDGLVNHISK